MTTLRQAPKRTAITGPERSVGNRWAAPAARVAGLIRPCLVAYALLAAGLAFVGWTSFDPLVLSARMVLYAVVAALAAAGAWASTRTRARTLSDLIAGAAGFVAGITVAVAVEGTPFPLGHVTGDIGFRLAAAERYSHGWAYGDMAYQALPAFYPSLVPYVAGRAAAIFAIPHYLAYKYVESWSPLPSRCLPMRCGAGSQHP